ncbi:phosphate-starvation-inducible PsiE family protein [Deinococcus aluminii]|uniref:Protein PsiE n=1 Tax=Deinococcus aluminii TaxID=1656885 RepID=A0ABP9XF54_9DEIO
MTVRPERASGSLRAVEHALYLGAAYLLIAAAVALLGNAVYEAAQAWRPEGMDAAIVRLLDRVLLALMLAEIIYTLRHAERTHALTAAPFLVIGIIAAVRRMLIITAESVSHADLHDPRFLAALAELVVLGVTILVFTLAIRWQVRSGGDSPEPAG